MSKLKPKWVFIGLTAIVAIVLIYSSILYPFLGKKALEEAGFGVKSEQIAPNFNVRTVEGNSISLSDYRGKVVVLDFTATWCGACEAQNKHLKQLHSDYKDRDVVIISIGVDPREDNEILRQYKIERGYDWIFASGPDVGLTYGITQIPTIYIIDQRGLVVFKRIGVTSYDTLKSEIERLLPKYSYGCC